MRAEALLELLQGVKRTARGWSSRCPAHNDKSPSLSIQEGQDGRILLHCFAGCPTQEVCGAIGIRITDLFGDSLTHKTPPRYVRQLRQQRQAVQKAREKRHKASGGAVDAVREAKQLAKRAIDIDISGWSDERLHDVLNGKDGLADAYEILHRDGALYEPF